MPSKASKSLSGYRRRLKRNGIVRVEIHVRKDDARLVRGVAKALNDPAQRNEVRNLLRDRFGAAEARGLKALLAAAPLQGIDLERDRDYGRKIEL
ncbi:MAG TPA: hypothetical protein VGX95_06675 [Xanthobacteraceae bacterium]|jgi:hypothetical protein|nr:hypothetical protein [Xanthobacteraceae bacterium]